MPISSTPCSLNRLRLSRSSHSSLVQVLEKASGKKTSATGLHAAEVAEPDVLAELVGELEVGGLGVGLQSHVESDPFVRPAIAGWTRGMIIRLGAQPSDDTAHGTTRVGSRNEQYDKTSQSDSSWHDTDDDPSRKRSTVTVNDQDPYSVTNIDQDPEETAEWQESLDAARRDARATAAGARSCSACSSARRTCTSACRWSRPRTTSTRSRPRTSPTSPATRSSSAATAPGSAGTPRSRCTAPSARASASAATSRPTPRPPRSTRSASTTSSAARTTRRRRPDLLPGPRLPRHVRPRVPRGPPQRGSSSTASARRSRRRRTASRRYPHPRLMPEFWQFPTVSMGLGPINAIYQAQSNKYLTNRGIKDASDQQVWAFLGDGEMDEVESRGAAAVWPRTRGSTT